jgi:hypothetical protein
MVSQLGQVFVAQIGRVEVKMSHQIVFTVATVQPSSFQLFAGVQSGRIKLTKMLWFPHKRPATILHIS